MVVAGLFSDCVYYRMACCLSMGYNVLADGKGGEMNSWHIAYGGWYRAWSKVQSAGRKEQSS